MRDLQPNSRDLTAKVRQVKEVLPQCTDDQCCQALVEADEDVMRAVELLLSAAPKATKKKKEKAPKDATSSQEHLEATPSATAGSNGGVQADRGGRPNSYNNVTAAEVFQPEAQREEEDPHVPTT